MTLENQKINKSYLPTRRELLKTAVMGGLATLGTFCYASRFEPNEIEVTRRDLALTGWPAANAGFRIGHLSDFHCINQAAILRTAHAVKLLLEQKPDVVFLTGDFITLHPKTWVPPCVAALAPLAQALPGCVFAVLGNHDWASHAVPSLTRHFASAGITLLRNQSAPLPSAPGVWVVGLDDLWAERADAETALKNVPADAIKLLLIHEPDYADESPTGFALQFSGHSHGGQICLPLLPPLHTPTFAQHYKVGLEQGPHHPIYVTRGVGMIGPQLRLFCPPEVTLLSLYSKT